MADPKDGRTRPQGDDDASSPDGQRDDDGQLESTSPDGPPSVHEDAPDTGHSGDTLYLEKDEIQRMRDAAREPTDDDDFGVDDHARPPSPQATPPPPTPSRMPTEVPVRWLRPEGSDSGASARDESAGTKPGSIPAVRWRQHEEPEPSPSGTSGGPPDPPSVQLPDDDDDDPFASQANEIPTEIDRTSRRRPEEERGRSTERSRPELEGDGRPGSHRKKIASTHRLVPETVPDDDPAYAPEDDVDPPGSVLYWPPHPSPMRLLMLWSTAAFFAWVCLDPAVARVAENLVARRVDWVLGVAAATAVVPFVWFVTLFLPRLRKPGPLLGIELGAFVATSIVLLGLTFSPFDWTGDRGTWFVLLLGLLPAQVVHLVRRGGYERAWLMGHPTRYQVPFLACGFALFTMAGVAGWAVEGSAHRGLERWERLVTAAETCDLMREGSSPPDPRDPWYRPAPSAIGPARLPDPEPRSWADLFFSDDEDLGGELFDCVRERLDLSRSKLLAVALDYPSEGGRLADPEINRDALDRYVTRLDSLERLLKWVPVYPDRTWASYQEQLAAYVADEDEWELCANPYLAAEARLVKTASLGTGPLLGCGDQAFSDRGEWIDAALGWLAFLADRAEWQDSRAARDADSRLAVISEEEVVGNMAAEQLDVFQTSLVRRDPQTGEWDRPFTLRVEPGGEPQSPMRLWIFAHGPKGRPPVWESRRELARRLHDSWGFVAPPSYCGDFHRLYNETGYLRVREEVLSRGIRANLDEPLGLYLLSMSSSPSCPGS